ncbi:MAG: hypothetical protein Q4G14_09645 [Paracoccus sp. (in: a-proteobacteria)]|uniref:hypothetical protein n=1 Tax=Paracoccus sp. TaxID=267 RepID=UPI0026DF9DC3|nr:hypothetical protein [Paracoccus sp. (in: a-proteobacteria)]MDO5613488.1 hypothetical protein [Paracoccus sp. (in: a-proteobacteria)]
MKPWQIYVLLLVYVAIGAVIDRTFWPDMDTMPTYTWNDFIQMVGIVVLCVLWQRADADQRGQTVGSGTRLLTILLTPLGLLVYLCATRRWWGVLVWIGFLFGIVLAYIVSSFSVASVYAAITPSPLN